MPKIKHILPIIIVAMLLILPAAAFADDIPDPGPDPVPLDGGLSVLIAAGVGYGVKKVRDNRQQRKQANKELN
jgi:hypothetical protein